MITNFKTPIFILQLNVGHMLAIFMLFVGSVINILKQMLNKMSLLWILIITVYFSYGICWRLNVNNFLAFCNMLYMATIFSQLYCSSQNMWLCSSLPLIFWNCNHTINKSCMVKTGMETRKCKITGVARCLQVIAYTQPVNI